MQKSYRPSPQDIDLLKAQVALGHESAVSDVEKERWKDIVHKVTQLADLAKKHDGIVPTQEMKLLYHQILMDIKLVDRAA